MILKTYTLGIDQQNRLYQVCGREVNSMRMTSEAAAAELDSRVRRYAQDRGLNVHTHYANLLHKILEGASDELKAAYAGVSSAGQAEGATPADEVDRRAKVYMREKNEKDYSVALRAILAADETLREAYALGEWLR